VRPPRQHARRGTPPWPRSPCPNRPISAHDET
jgi:hypothetical protein